MEMKERKRRAVLEILEKKRKREKERIQSWR